MNDQPKKRYDAVRALMDVVIRKSNRPTVRDVLAAWGVSLNDRQAEQLLAEMNEAAKEHTDNA